MRLQSLLLLLVLLWAVAATGLSAKLYLDARSLESRVQALEAILSNVNASLAELVGRAVIVNLAIDYGNGTVRWFNGTVLPRGASVLQALVAVAGRVEYSFGAYGAYVRSVDGVEEKILAPSEGYSWLWYIYDRSSGRWVLGPSAADAYKLEDGAQVKWAYEHWKF